MSRGIFLNDQKGCRKRTRGTEELLYIYQHILNKSKMRRKNLAVARINDKKKAYDMATKLDTKQFQNVINTRPIVQFIKKTMKTWRAELTAGGKT